MTKRPFCGYENLIFFKYGFIMKSLSLSALSLLFLTTAELQASKSSHAPESVEEFFENVSRTRGIPTPQEWSLHQQEDFERIFEERVAGLSPDDAKRARIQKAVFEAKTQILVKARRREADLVEICDALRGTLTFLHQEQLKALDAGVTQDVNKHFFFSALSFNTVQEVAKLIPILTAKSLSYSKRLNEDKELPYPFLDKDAFERTHRYLSQRIAFDQLYNTLKGTPYIFGVFSMAGTLSKKLVTDSMLPEVIRDQDPLTVCKHTFYSQDLCFNPLSALLKRYVDEKEVRTFEGYIEHSSPEKRQEVESCYRLCAALVRQQAPFFDEERTGASNSMFTAYATLMQSYADRIEGEYRYQAVMSSSSSSSMSSSSPSQEVAPPRSPDTSAAKARRNARKPKPEVIREKMRESLEARIGQILETSRIKYASLGDDATGELVLIASRLTQTPQVPALKSMVDEMEKVTKTLDTRLAAQRRQLLKDQRSQASSSSSSMPFVATEPVVRRNERASVLEGHLAAGTLTKDDLKKPKKKAQRGKGASKRGKKPR